MKIVELFKSMNTLDYTYIDITNRHGKEVADKCVEESKNRVLSLKDYYSWFVLCNLSFEATNNMYNLWIETTKNSGLFQKHEDFYWSVRNARGLS